MKLQRVAVRPAMARSLILATVASVTSCVSAILLFAIAAPLWAQQTEAPSLAPVVAQPAEVEAPPDDAGMPDPTPGLIHVDVVVTDKAGKTVSDLPENDFTLLDNNQKQKIVTFQSVDHALAPSASSLEVVLVIDELNMPPTPRNGNRELSEADRETENFLRAHGGVLEYPTILYRLTADGLFATLHPSTDGNALAKEIEKPNEQVLLWSPSAITKDIGSITDSDNVSWRITHSLVALGSIAIEERRRPGRKLMFWIGNGWQIMDRRIKGLSDFSIELLTRMREARINLWGASEWPLYDVHGNPTPVKDYVYEQFLGGPKPDSTELDYLSLPVVAARSGGGVLYTKRNLAAMIEERVKQAGRFYSLTFDPPRTGVVDEYHHLKMEIDRPDVTAHVFEDYYDQPVHYDQPADRKPETVKQLEDIVANAHSASELARQLDGIKLTERLSGADLTNLERQVHGGKAREAFEVLTDESEFLAPPAEKIPSEQPPEMARQRQIISSAIAYINTAIPRLPDFFATRTTVQYQELLPKPNQTWKTARPDQPLHQGETTTDSIRFHDGKELAEQKSVKSPPHKPGSEQLTTIGAFGPILAAVMTAATSPDSELTWSRWEQDDGRRLAVFRYRVPQATRLFSTGFCCLLDNFGGTPFSKHAPFHGEITVDPSTGAIMRLTLQADLAWRLPLERSDIMVEYRPVVMHGHTFICPSKSVTISRQRRRKKIDEWGESFQVYAPFETLLNEMRFEKYHFFGSTSRILPGFVEAPKDK